MKKQILTRFLILITTGSLTAQAQPNLKRDSGRVTPEMYIDMFKDAAIADMMKTGVPASITLAQGMYESDYGNSPLAVAANNHFGIKCHKEWDGATFHKDDDAPNECFRKYESVLHSYDDHSDFLRSRERYHMLFNLEITDYKGWSHGLKKAGYATNPAYAGKLIGLIEKYRLYEFDAQGVRIPVTGAEEKSSERRELKTAPVRKSTLNSNNSSGVSDANTVNGVPFVFARKGDTWTRLASENNIELWQVLEFNEAGKNDILKEGDRVYVKAKKNKSSELNYVITDGESMRDISQKYGVKLSRLYKMNEMSFGAEPESGKKIFLKRAMLFGIVL